MIGTVVLLAPGARIWHADGIAATVTTIDAAGVMVRVNGEHAPVRIHLPGWALALACDYCTSPATVQMRYEQSGDLLCRDCAHDHFERPADWVRPIPRTVIRQLHGQCEPLS